LHASEQANDEEECDDAKKDVEEGLSDTVGIEDEEGKNAGSNAIEKVVNIVAGKIDMYRIGIVECTAKETDDAVAGEVDETGGGEADDESEHVDPDIGETWGKGIVGHEGDGEKHEGGNDGLVGSMGEVGIAEEAVHGTGVDGGVEQVDNADLFVA